MFAACFKKNFDASAMLLIEKIFIKRLDQIFWTHYLYSKNWSSEKNQTLDKVKTSCTDEFKPTQKIAPKHQTNSHEKPTILLPNRGSSIQNFENNFKTLCPAKSKHSTKGNIMPHHPKIIYYGETNRLDTTRKSN